MILDEEMFKAEAVRLAAFLFAESARTAPKSKGEDSLHVVYVDGYELRRIADEMEKIGVELKEEKGWKRDAESVRKASGILLIGVDGSKPLNLNCGACGFKSCAEFQKAARSEVKYTGPNCIFKVLDLGIAIGSAAKLASIVGLDTRIMYRAGLAAKRLGYVRGDIILALPIASLGKNPFFDRKD